MTAIRKQEEMREIQSMGAFNSVALLNRPHRPTEGQNTTSSEESNRKKPLNEAMAWWLADTAVPDNR